MKDDDLEAAKRMLLARSDVSDVTIVPNGIEVIDEEGNDGTFVSFSEAVSWLVGADDHLVGLAACACKLCGPYHGPR